MDIILTEIEKKFLTEFAKKQFEGADDNLGTRTPIHLVERKHREFISDGSEEVWIDSDNGQEFDSFDDLINFKRENGYDLPDYDDVDCTTVNEVWIYSHESYLKAFRINAYSGRFVEHYQPIAFFFTLDEAKRYKNEYQKHNCADCRTYTYSLGYDNRGDMPVFRALLMRLGQELLKETETSENN